MTSWRGLLSSAPDAQAFGAALGALLEAGDLLVLNGPLGAGKTTLTQGLAGGMGVRGPITSPTFVIARVHPSLVDGPKLVHVDAYRLGGSAELDDLDLDTEFEQAVTVVEWGAGLAESLGENRLEITLSPSSDGSRQVAIVGVGQRWVDADTFVPLARWCDSGEEHDIS